MLTERKKQISTADNINVEPASNNAPSPYKVHVSSIVSTVGKVANYIFTPDNAPSWNHALLKTGMGCVGFLGMEKFSQAYLPGSYLVPIISAVSAGFFMTGVRETCFLAYNKIIYPPAPSRNETPHLFTKYQNRVNEKNKQLARCIKIAQLILLSYVSIDGLWNYDTLGSNTFLKNVNRTSNDIIISLNTQNLALAALQASAYIANLVINVREFRHVNQDYFLTSNPFNQIIWSFALGSYFSQIGELSSKQRPWYNCIMEFLELYPGGLYPEEKKQFYNDVDLHCTKFLPEYNKFAFKQEVKNKIIINSDAGKFRSFYHSFVASTRHVVVLCTLQTVVVQGLFLLSNNMRNYWNSNPELVKTDISPSLHNKKIKTRKQHSNTPHSQNTTIPVSSESFIDPISTTKMSIRKEIESNYIPEKKKTRCKAEITNITSPKHPIKHATLACSTVTESLDHPDREAALARIQKLRKQHPVKAVTIDEELRQAVRFLNGKIKSVDGSKFSLDWTIGKNRYSLNFEKPHGKDSSNYRGNKLDRVLSVLETSYLIGLSEESAEKYINEYNLHNLYRLKKYISYIFLHRTSEESN